MNNVIDKAQHLLVLAFPTHNVIGMGNFGVCPLKHHGTLQLHTARLHSLSIKLHALCFQMLAVISMK